MLKITEELTCQKAAKHKIKKIKRGNVNLWQSRY
jgi:hypothetical protein